MIDIYTWVIDNTTYYSKMERTITDVIVIPTGLPPDASLICANDWRGIIGEPVLKEDGTMETFEEREVAFLTKMGWKLGMT